MAVLVLHFGNFKSLSKNKRIYYYNGEDYYDFYFLSDGFIVKTTLSKDDIEDIERFFADSMFYGSMELMFKIPDPKVNILEDVTKVNIPLEAPETIVDESQDLETENRDIQRDGVDKDDLY